MPKFSDDSLKASLKDFMAYYSWGGHKVLFEKFSRDSLSLEEQKIISELFIGAFSKSFHEHAANLQKIITQKNNAANADNDLSEVIIKDCDDLIKQLRTILLAEGATQGFESVFKSRIKYIADELDFNQLCHPALTEIILFSIIRGFLRWYTKDLPEKAVDLDAVDAKIKLAIWGNESPKILSETIPLVSVSAADNLIASSQEATFSKNLLTDNLSKPLLEIIQNKVFWFKIHHEEVKKPIDIHNLFSGLVYNFLPRFEITNSGGKIEKKPSAIVTGLKNHFRILQAITDKFSIELHCKEIITAIRNFYSSQAYDELYQKIKQLLVEAKLDEHLLNQNGCYILPGIIDGFCKWYADNILEGASIKQADQYYEQFIAHKDKILHENYTELRSPETNDDTNIQTQNYESSLPDIINFPIIVQRIIVLTSDRNNTSSRPSVANLVKQINDSEKIILMDFFTTCKNKDNFSFFLEKMREAAWATDASLINKHIDNRFENFFSVFNAVFIDAALKANQHNPVDFKLMDSSFVQIKNEFNLAMLNATLLKNLQQIDSGKFITINDSSNLHEINKSELLLIAADQAIKAVKAKKPSLLEYFFSRNYKKNQSLYNEQKTIADKIKQLAHGIRCELRNTKSKSQSKTKDHTTLADARSTTTKSSIFGRFFYKRDFSTSRQPDKAEPTTSPAPESG